MYELRYHGPEPADFHVYRLYPNGRRQKVSEQQDLYQAWLAAGNSPTVVAYTPPAEPPAPIFSADEQAVYASILSLWAQTGSATVPATFDEAVATVKTWLEDSADFATYKARAAVKDELITRRIQMQDHAWPWDRFLAYVSALQA